MTDTFHFENLASRQKQIDDLINKRNASKRKFFLDEEANEYDEAIEVEIDSKYLIFNPDNTRIRTTILNHLEQVSLSDDGENAIDTFYQKKENKKTQDYLFQTLTERAKSGASIYNQLKRTRNQTEHLIIDSDGVIVDGNRRFASMLWLYSENPSKYKFKKIKCWVLPENSNNRENNEKHETVIHHAESYQEPHSWIDIAYGCHKKIESGQTAAEIAKYYKTNATKVYQHKFIAVAVDKYIEFRRKLDPTFEDYVDIFEEIKKEQVQQDLTDVAKILKEATDDPVENLEISKRIESVFLILLCAKQGLDAVDGRKYLLTNNSKRLLKAVNKVQKLNADCTFKDFQKSISSIAKQGISEKEKIVKKISDEVTKSSETEDEESRKQYTLKQLKEIQSNLTVLQPNVMKDTTDDKHFENSLEAIEESKKLLKKIKDKLTNFKSN